MNPVLQNLVENVQKTTFTPTFRRKLIGHTIQRNALKDDFIRSGQKALWQVTESGAAGGKTCTIFRLICRTTVNGWTS